MGNCQAIDAAALVIQHPNGRIERLYWPVTASEVMRKNPGHYVSLIIPLPLSSSHHQQNQEHEEKENKVRFTRVKLLRPNDTLALGHAYRLVTTQEVMKVLRSKKYAKGKRQEQESDEKPKMESEKKHKRSSDGQAKTEPQKNINHQTTKLERHQLRTTTSTNAAVMRSKSWRPSLQSISEFVS